MIVLKIITTWLIASLMSIILWFLAHSEKTHVEYIGFGFMELVYVMSLICMWG